MGLVNTGTVFAGKHPIYPIKAESGGSIAASASLLHLKLVILQQKMRLNCIQTCNHTCQVHVIFTQHHRIRWNQRKRRVSELSFVHVFTCSCMQAFACAVRPLNCLGHVLKWFLLESNTLSPAPGLMFMFISQQTKPNYGQAATSELFFLFHTSSKKPKMHFKYFFFPQPVSLAVKYYI